VFILGAIKP